jgi:hypothetical protein
MYFIPYLRRIDAEILKYKGKNVCVNVWGVPQKITYFPQSFHTGLTAFVCLNRMQGSKPFFVWAFMGESGEYSTV